MKALSFKIPNTGEDSFRIQIDEDKHFYDRFHHHQELQITTIEKSHGTLLIGNTATAFEANDLFIIGANVPHSFRNHPSFYQSSSNEARSLSIFFNAQSFGDGFFDLPELKKVKKLLKEANYGIRVYGETKSLVCSKIKVLQQSEGLNRLIQLLEILNVLANSKEITLLSNVPYFIQTESMESNKLESIFQYVLDHYERPIKLEEVATLSNLSISAFCRFFKSRTRKTFARFVNELRISMASKHLLSSDHSISEICYQVGFSNLSNFNRQFKEITGQSPSKFVQMHKKV